MSRLHGGPPERLARAGVTEREAEVLSAVAERLHNREIAERLYISVRTDESAALLQGHRLLTLTGPAGAGKTRLALHVAASVAERFPDEARLADLAAVASADLVADTLARALGVSPQPTRPVRDSLRDGARELHCLLLVDNCEHVVAEAAELVSDLLAAGGQLRVLATSREVLGVPG